jgi:flagellar biosynthesis protein FliR
MLAPGIIEAFGLYAVRTSAMVISAPIIGVGTRFSGYKVGLILAVSALLYGVSGQPLPGFEPLLYAGMALRELLIGLFLSFILHLSLIVVRVGGQLIGQEMGFMMASQVDPVTGLQTPLITTFYETLFMLALLAMNGHFLLFRALSASFEQAPIGALSFSGGIGSTIGTLFSQMFEAGIVFAAPIMTLLFLVSLMIGLLSRAVPQLNVMELSFSIRIVLALLVMFGFAPLLAPAMERITADFGRALETALQMLST